MNNVLRILEISHHVEMGGIIQDAMFLAKCCFFEDVFFLKGLYDTVPLIF